MKQKPRTKKFMNNLLEAYKNTKYIVFEPTLIIEIDKLNHEINDLLINHKTNTWAFITAFNPYSKV